MLVVAHLDKARGGGGELAAELKAAMRVPKLVEMGSEGEEATVREVSSGSPARARLRRLVRGRAAPEVATPAVGVPVVFYCHFPDKLLATGEAAGAAGSASLLPRPRTRCRPCAVR